MSRGSGSGQVLRALAQLAAEVIERRREAGGRPGASGVRPGTHETGTPASGTCGRDVAEGRGGGARPQKPAEAARIAGRWCSLERVSPGSGGLRDFYLDIVIGPDGLFRGSHAGYFCVDVPVFGPFGVPARDCRRGDRLYPAHGRLDTASGRGRIVLADTGSSKLTGVGVKPQPVW
ncbi:hypothetical protein [Frankia sp. CcWB2]